MMPPDTSEHTTP